MAQSGTNPKQIVEEKGLIQISDPNIIFPIIDDVIAKILQWKNTKEEIKNYLVSL